MNQANDTFVPVPDDEPSLSVSQMHEGLSSIGQTLKGRYVIEKQLAAGGFGMVFLARDEDLLGKKVVVKLLREKALGDEWAVKKFNHEIEALTRIDHPGVVGVFDTGKTPEGVPFLVMQYVEGRNLRSALKPEGMDLEQAANIFRQLGQALSAAHDKQVVHRDLKPENIMLQVPSSGGQVKIIDFGIAKVRSSLVAPSTEVPTAAGTIAYMSPEQLNAHPVSAPSDIYSLGTIAYEMLTGRRPFNPETLFQLNEMQRAGVKVKPSDLRPGLPATVDRVILKALSHTPEERYASAHAFTEALANALTERHAPRIEIDSRAETLPMSPALVVKPRKRKAVLVVAGMILLLGVIAAVMIWRSGRQEGNAPVQTEPPRAVASSPVRTLDYVLTVQQMKDGTPYKDPFPATGKEILLGGYQVKVNVSNSQMGFLYLVNEGPAGKGVMTYNLLFPTPSANDGSAHLDSGQHISTNWLQLDEHEGTENFWIIWSDAAVPELEAVKGVVNKKQQGTISDSRQADAVRDLLGQYAIVAPEISTDEATKVNHLTAHAKVLAHLIKIEHR
jgi:tRNA A-37 threonylcarbamoyl transferase component Bud32